VSYRIIHYINQFYAGIGGEEKADVAPEIREGVVGPGMALKAALGTDAEIVATVVCGDSYFASNIEKATADILEMMKKYKPDAVIAGPAFNAGRYGTACGGVCEAVVKKLGIPAVSGMFPENPGVEMYKKSFYIVETPDSAAGMRKAVPAMAKLVLRLLKGEKLGTPAEEGYIERASGRTSSMTSSPPSGRWTCSPPSSRESPSSPSIPCPFSTGLPPTRRSRT